MIFTPFPRLVLPIRSPPPLAEENVASMKHSEATLAQAHQAIAAVRGTLYRQAKLGASAVRERVSTGLSKSVGYAVGNVFSIGPAVSYGPDFFGGVHRQIEQQTALTEVQQYELAADGPAAERRL
jgi:outer membrane protein TolC